MRHLFVVALLGATCMPAMADAQQIIMRKPLSGAVFGDGAGGYQNPAGEQTPTPTPAVPIVAGSWTTSAPRVIAPSCSATAPATRDVWCASPDGARLADANCAAQGAKPSAAATIADWSGCGYAWQPVGTTSWSSTCSDEAVATRSYVCQRQDGTTAAASNCDASHKESETETAANLTTCVYEVSAWRSRSYSSTCSSKAVVTYDATSCIRSGGGEIPQQVSVEACRAAGEPMTKETVQEVYYGCNYTPTYSTTYGTCANGEQSAPIASCQRSDGTDVPVAECSGSKQSTSRTCVVARTCAAFVQPMAVTGISSNGTSTTLGDVYAATHDLRMAAARTLCEKAAPPGAGYTLAYCQAFDGYADKTRAGVRGNWNTGTPAAKYTISTDASSYAAFSTAACSGG